MDIAYIDESSISADDPVIILTSGSVDDLNLPNNQLVVVHEVSTHILFIYYYFLNVFKIVLIIIIF